MSAATIDAIVQEAAAALRDLYGQRLRQVLLYGSYARGEADEESDIDLLIVLTEMDSPYAEIEYMGDVTWGLTLKHGVTLSAIPLAADRFDRAETAFLRRIHAEGRAVA